MKGGDETGKNEKLPPLNPDLEIHRP